MKIVITGATGHIGKPLYKKHVPAFGKISLADFAIGFASLYHQQTQQHH
jgi:hypothetical protein